MSSSTNSWNWAARTTRAGIGPGETLVRVNGRLVARRDQLVPGVRYEAAVRLLLDGNQLPKPFQVSALANREWTLASPWKRWELSGTIEQAEAPR